MNDFITFRRMITPIIIQAIFWTVVAVSIIVGLGLLFATDEAITRVMGLLVIVLGPLVARIYAEILLVVFRINETLTDISNDLRTRS